MGLSYSMLIIVGLSFFVFSSSRLAYGQKCDGFTTDTCKDIKRLDLIFLVAFYHTHKFNLSSLAYKLWNAMGLKLGKDRTPLAVVQIFGKETKINRTLLDEKVDVQESIFSGPPHDPAARNYGATFTAGFNLTLNEILQTKVGDRAEVQNILVYIGREIHPRYSSSFNIIATSTLIESIRKKDTQVLGVFHQIGRENLSHDVLFGTKRKDKSFDFTRDNLDQFVESMARCLCFHLDDCQVEPLKKPGMCKLVTGGPNGCFRKIGTVFRYATTNFRTDPNYQCPFDEYELCPHFDCDHLLPKNTPPTTKKLVSIVNPAKNTGKRNLALTIFGIAAGLVGVAILVAAAVLGVNVFRGRRMRAQSRFRSSKSKSSRSPVPIKANTLADKSTVTVSADSGSPVNKSSVANKSSAIKPSPH